MTAPSLPILDEAYAILSAPVRHVLMIGTVWYATQQGRKPDLHILEVGSWYGASALSWAQGMMLHNGGQGHLTCVDAWEPYLDRTQHTEEVYTAMEHALDSGEAYHRFLHNTATLPKGIHCQPHRGKSIDILPQLPKGVFDIAFIDADHTYQAVLQDITLALPLVREGGILCGDDLNLQLPECDAITAHTHKEKDYVCDPKTGRNFHPGVTLAVHDIFGEVSAWGGFWAMQKKAGSWKPISLRDMPVHYPAHFHTNTIEQAKAHLIDISPLR